MLLNFLNNEEGSNISKNSEIERHAVMASILHPPKTMTPKHLRNALTLALAGLSMRINRFTPDDAAERVARRSPSPPPV